VQQDNSMAALQLQLALAAGLANPLTSLLAQQLLLPQEGATAAVGGPQAQGVPGMAGMTPQTQVQGQQQQPQQPQPQQQQQDVSAVSAVAAGNNQLAALQTLLASAGLALAPAQPAAAANPLGLLNPLASLNPMAALGFQQMMALQQQQQQQQQGAGHGAGQGASGGGSGSGGVEVQKRQISYWTPEEKATFVDVFKKSGRDWALLSEKIPGKTVKQIKTFYQNYKQKLGLEVDKKQQQQPQQQQQQQPQSQSQPQQQQQQKGQQ